MFRVGLPHAVQRSDAAFAGEELEVHRRIVHSVLPEQPARLLELRPDVVARQEDLGRPGRVRRLHGRVAVSGREHEAVDIESGEVGVKGVDLRDVGVLVDGGVRADHVARFLRRLDAGDSQVENAVAFDGLVVRLAQTVEMDVEEHP